MSVWISNCNTAHMANNLVKWWRTKFLNGYKPFTVECSEGRASDTEELLGRKSPEFRTSCTTPPLQNQTTHTPPLPSKVDAQTPQQTEHLKVQEFSCDVSVEGGPDKATLERREFSFTLYDFDGHGKITKDDIAGLVTTIYDVLGSSVKVPHYGSKTIKVKLTVSPDQRKHVSATVIGHQDKSEEKQQDQNGKAKQDLNVTVKEPAVNNDKKKRSRTQRKRPDRKHYCCRKLEEENEIAADISEDYSDVCSRLSADVTSEDEEGERFENRRFRRLHQTRYQKHSTTRYTTPNRCSKESSTVNQKDNFLRSKKVKKRSSSLQRQELLEIIQSNMDKNNPSFQTTRKPCSDHINVENSQLSQNNLKQRHRHKSMQPSMPLQYLTNVVDPTHFYVDLASLQNTTRFPQNNYQYDKLVDAVMRVSNKKVSEAKPESFKRHNRTKSYDISNAPLRYQLLDHPILNIENVNKNSKKQMRKLTDFEPTAAVKKNIRKFPQVVVGHTSPHHHQLRHRNRQEDQARAMAQVVRWLEQEFSSNLHTQEKTKEKVQSNSWAGDQEKYSCSMPASPNSGIERHEHHHVHEHIHHHYHHYQETPIVV